MSQTALSILLGLLAGAAGALAVQFVGGGTGSSGSALSGDGVDGPAIEARLERIEGLLARTDLLSAPALRGSTPRGGDARALGNGADLEALAARLEERLKPMVQESVRTSVKEALAANEEGAERDEETDKNRVTLAEAAAELGLTREEEDAVRRIAGETQEEFFKLLVDEDQTVDDVKREFEDAKGDPQKRQALTTKYMGKVLGNLGGLVSLGLNWQRKMKDAVGAEKAKKIEDDYSLTDLDPYELEEMFDFD